MNSKYIASVLFVIISFGFARHPHAASFNCDGVVTAVEKIVCDSPVISKLDEELGQDYTKVLAKINGDAKYRVVAEQKYWLLHSRNVCKNENCLKHAYWARKAELETFFVQKSPLYQHEEEKRELIKRILEKFPLHASIDTDFCRAAMSGLKKMTGIQFVDPLVQAQSYEDPKLEPWKKSCKGKAPMHFSYDCPSNISPDDKDSGLEICSAGYGVPPFKIFELPKMAGSNEARYIFYSSTSYGPMNDSAKEPHVGGGFSGFHQINFEQCDELPDNGFSQASTRTNADNYDSIIEYRKKYFFLMLSREAENYWMKLDQLGGNETCLWTPVKTPDGKKKGM